MIRGPKGSLIGLQKPIIIAILGLFLTLTGCAESDFTDVEYVQRAKEYQDQGKSRSAVIDLKNALQLNPKNFEARQLLGEIYVEEGNGFAGEKELRRAVELGVATESVAVPLAKALLLQGKNREIVESTPVLDAMPANIKASLHVLRGRAYLGLDDRHNATAEFQSALDVKKDSVAAWFGQALLAYANQAWNEAHGWLEKVLKATPNAAEALALQGNLATIQLNFVEAEKAFQHAVKLRPLVPVYRLALANAQISLNKLDEAIANLEWVLNALPNDRQGNYLRALAAYQKQDFENAKFYAEKVLNADPGHLRSRLVAGAASYALGQIETANLHLSSFISRVPAYEPALKLMAAIKIQLGLPEEAAVTLQPVALSNEDTQLLTAIGTVALRTGDFQLSRDLFQKAVDLQPDQSLARAQLGVAKVMLGENEQGIRELEQAIQLDPKLKEAEFNIIAAYLRAREYDAALESANRMREKYADSPALFTLMGLAYLGKSEPERAQEAFHQALAHSPGYFPAAHQLAQLAQRRGDMEDAKAFYEKVLEQQPTQLDALLMLARLEARQGKVKDAIARLEYAMQKNPEALQPRVLLARYYLYTNQAAKALAITSAIQENYPNDSALLIEIGNAQLAMGQSANAVATFEKLVSTVPNSAEAHYRLASAYAEINDVNGSHRELNKALSLNPDHFFAKLTMVRLLVLENQLDQAIQLFQELKQANPDHPEVLAQEGRLAILQNQPQAAVTAYRKALAQFPSSKWTVNLAQAEWLTDGSEASIATLSNWLDKHPSDTVVQYALADIYLTLNRSKEAKEAFAKVIEQDPNNVLSLNNLAWLLREEDPQRAVTYAERALELAPNAPAVMDTLGMILLQQDQPERAIRLLRGAAAKAPDNPTFQYHLAVALAQNGSPEEAQKILNETLQESKAFAEKEAAQILLQDLTKD